METLLALFSEHSFMPHGHCYLWTPSLLWLQVLTNGVIGLSYVAISAALVDFIRRAGDLPLRFLYIAFGVFIIACGFTHFMDVLVIWQPRYWLDGGLRFITALASVGTAIVLPRFVPHGLLLLQGAQTMRREGVAMEKAIADLSTLYRRTRELDQRKTDFFANASHELRTPLTLILTPVDDLLRRTDLPADVLRQLEVVQRSARGLLSHVNDLLDVQKLDAGKLQPIYGKIDLAELVRGTVAQFDSVASERGIQLTIETPTNMAGEADAAKLRRVLMNLLANAFNFTQQGGSIAVQLSAIDHEGADQALLRVADSGPGVLPEDRERIFERFGQGTSRAARREGGTGLGLAIVREFVELHGGRVEVKDAQLGGASFEARWPLAAPANAPVVRISDPSALAPDASAERDAASELEAQPFPLRALAAPANEQPEGAHEQGAATLVLAEDNDDLRRLLVNLLRPRYRVLEARDGEEAFALTREHFPDAIVSDLMMPKVSGEELVLRVRALPELADIPILLLTAKADETLRAHILRSGAQDFLLKPFEREELLARVQNLVVMRRTYALLRAEVEAQEGDVEALSRELIGQKRKLERALIVTREAQQAAELASRQKSDFLSLVSHELRTPLTSIRLHIERLKRGRAGTLVPGQLELIAKVERSSARLLEMVESLLQFGRLEAGRLEITSVALDLAELAREVVDELRPRAEAKGLSLRVEPPEGDLRFSGDPQLVRLILENLCDNAIKYTREGDVVISLSRLNGGDVMLKVKDTGPGIEQSAQERVFLPFEQLEPVRHKQGAGVGLGLALVKRVAETLKAEVALESAQGVGSTFTVTFKGAGSPLGA